MTDKVTISVDATVADLESKGWKKVQEPTAGSVVVWGVTEGGKNKHIGIVISDNKAINNSSYALMPVITSIYDEDRPVLFFMNSPLVKTLDLKPLENEKRVPLGKWKITRYYTPVKNQKRYFNKKGGYASDFYINCQGDCLTTADGTKLTPELAFKNIACPKDYALGSKFFIEGIGYVICHDRGGAIKNKRIDLWTGIGDTGLTALYDRPETSGEHEVFLIK